MAKTNMHEYARNALENLAVSIHQAHSEFCFDFENDSAEINTKANGSLTVFPDDKSDYEFIHNYINKAEQYINKVGIVFQWLKDRFNIKFKNTQKGYFVELSLDINNEIIGTFPITKDNYNYFKDLFRGLK